MTVYNAPQVQKKSGSSRPVVELSLFYTWKYRKAFSQVNRDCRTCSSSVVNQQVEAAPIQQMALEATSPGVEGVRAWTEPVGRNLYAVWSFFVSSVFVSSSPNLASAPPTHFEPIALIACSVAAFWRRPPCTFTPLPLVLRSTGLSLRRAGSLPSSRISQVSCRQFTPVSHVSFP